MNAAFKGFRTRIVFSKQVKGFISSIHCFTVQLLLRIGPRGKMSPHQTFSFSATR